MAMKEGRCPNCGSILHLESSAEKGHCMFCDAVFANQEAFAIAKNPDGHTFANEPQPKYEGPDLNARSNVAQKPKREQQKPSRPKPPPPPVFEFKEPEEMPDIRLPGKIKLRIVLIALALIILVSGIVVPIVIRRDSVRDDLASALPQLAHFPVDAESGFAIWQTNNNYFMVATDADITLADATLFFTELSQKRADLLGIDPADFSAVCGSVKLKLVYPGGGYLIDRPLADEDLAIGRAIKELP